jgi:hypothetical protein
LRLLSKGFIRIRNFWSRANRQRATRLAWLLTDASVAGAVRFAEFDVFPKHRPPPKQFAKTP